MNTQSYLSLITGLFMLFLLIGSSCARPKYLNRQKLTESKQQELHILQQQEKVLVTELKEYIQPPIWEILKEKVIREVKEYPPAAKHQLETSISMHTTLTQALQEFKSSGNLDAQERAAAVLVELIEGGFKAETVEQAKQGLEKWITLLRNLKRQHKFIKYRG